LSLPSHCVNCELPSCLVLVLVGQDVQEVWNSSGW